MSGYLNEHSDSSDKKSINYSQCSFYYEDEIIEKLKLSDYDKIVVLADEDSDENNYSDITKIDSDTLFKLLKIINIKQKMYATLDFKLISEIVDPESEEVVNKIPSSSFGYVVGTLITSKILNMTFVNNNIINVFNQLIQRGGVDISTGNFCNLSEISFKALTIHSYLNDNKIPIGVIKDGKIILNPPFDEKIKKNDEIVYLERDHEHIESDL